MDHFKHTNDEHPLNFQQLPTHGQYCRIYNPTAYSQLTLIQILII